MLLFSLPAYFNILRAERFAKVGDIQNAKRLYELILAKYPTYNKALKALEALDHGSAKSNNVDKRAPDHLIQFLIKRFNEGHFLEVLEHTKKLQANYQDSTDVLSICGAVHSKLGQNVEALACYTKIIQISPNRADAYNDMGQVLHELGRVDEAIAQYSKALEVRPDYSEAHYNLANIYMSKSLPKQAISSFKKALLSRPDFVLAHNNLAISYIAIGKNDDALASYASALKYKPEQADFHYNLGNLLYKIGRIDDAAESFSNALQYRHKFAQSHCMLGNIYKDQERYEAAIESYDKAIKFKADYLKAYWNKAYVQNKVDDIVGALNSVETALKLDPENLKIQQLYSIVIERAKHALPEDRVTDIFDNYAEIFENHLVTNLNYSVPQKLRAMLEDKFVNLGRYSNMFDLGCGTGLGGVAFKDIVDTIIGVDLSNKMIEKAYEKDLYSRLIVGNINTPIKEYEGEIDLVLASDVFIYIGDLDETFAQISKYTRKNAVILFSTEQKNGRGFKLLNTSRYCHSKSYIQSVSKAHGFSIIAYKEDALRRENSLVLAGGYYILSVD